MQSLLNAPLRTDAIGLFDPGAERLVREITQLREMHEELRRTARLEHSTDEERYSQRLRHEKREQRDNVCDRVVRKRFQGCRCAESENIHRRKEAIDEAQRVRKDFLSPPASYLLRFFAYTQLANSTRSATVRKIP